MKKVLFISLLLFELLPAQINKRFPPKITNDIETAMVPSWYDAKWGYRRKLTIDYTKVSATLTNFPVLLSLASDTGLANRAKTDGSDIVFTSDGTTKIYYELETFTKSTGAIKAWINVPSVSHTVNTNLWMYYGNADAVADNFNGWDSTVYSVVQHMENRSYEAYKYPEGLSTIYPGEDYLTEPSVVIMPNNTFRMYVHILNNGDFIYLYTSTYGVTWTTGGIVGNMCRLHVFYNSDSSKYFAYAIPAWSMQHGINIYKSVNGTLADPFVLSDTNIIPLGVIGAWDEWGHANPYLWREGNIWHVMYAASPEGTQWLAGHAWSADGKSWIKDPDNNITTSGWTEHALYDGGWIKKVGNYYYWCFHGRGDWLNESYICGTDEYLARSVDLHNWEVSPVPLVMRTKDWEGTGEDVEGQVADAFLVEKQDTTYIYYEGLKYQDQSEPYRIGLLRIPQTIDSIFANYPFMYNSTSWDNNIKHAVLPFSITGKINYATKFNAVSSYINLGNIPELNTVTKLTVSGWVYVDSLDDFAGVVSTIESSTKAWGIYKTEVATGLIRVRVANGSSTSYGQVDWELGSWKYWTMVFDGTQADNATRLKFYQNGVQQTLSFTGTIPSSISNTGEVLLGCTSVGSEYFGGRIDELRISNDAKTTAWILTEYNNQNSPSTFIIIE